MKNFNMMDKLALVLVIIGGLNWGLVGAFKFDLVEAILGDGVLARLVYVLVGLSAVYAVSFLMKTEEPTENKEN
ncbi:MAG: DUF378 domain-containing protein [Candidatus Moranbacteria bacterium]|jgi:uncharacterized membrane protein YuzA (DUF378 family)|nr:DUF378 domain-containing protein [Candidatus Moranbacteria bacterium]